MSDTTKSIFSALNFIQSLLNWLEKRGMSRDRSLALLDRAELEQRDLTTDEVQSELDLSRAELDDTQKLIDESGS